MNIIKFFKSNNIDRDADFRTGKKCYKDSDTPIRYIRLNDELDNGQTYLVCSRGLAEAINDGQLKLADAEVTKNAKGIWGLIRPDSSKGEIVRLWD